MNGDFKEDSGDMMTETDGRQHRSILQNIAHRTILESGLVPEFPVQTLAQLDPTRTTLITGDYIPRVTRLRGPVFARATYAMLLTMVAGIIGASVAARSAPRQ